MIGAALFLLTGSVATGGEVMAGEQAISMRVDENAETVQVELVANSPRAQVVEYRIEVGGNSRSKHSGKTTVAADAEAVLSRFRVSHDGTWCATAEIVEQSGATYRLEAGDCSQESPE